MRKESIVFLLCFFLFLPQRLPAQEKGGAPVSASSQNSLLNDYLDMAALFKESGDYGQALSVLETVYKCGIDDRGDKYLGKLYYLTGELQQAKTCFQRVGEKDWYVFLYLGLIYEQLNEENSAVKNYLKSVEMKENSIALYRLAKIYYNRGQYDSAIKFFSKVVFLDSSIRLAYYYLGDCFFKTGDLNRAYDYLSKAVNFYPQNKQMQEKLTDVKDKLGSDFFAEKEKKKIRERKEVKLSAYRKGKDITLVKIGIAQGLKKFTFKQGGDFFISRREKDFNGRAGMFYTVALENGRLLIRGYEDGKAYGELLGPIHIYPCSENRVLDAAGPLYPFYILDLVYGKDDFWHKKIDRAYRGDLEVIADGQTLTLVNILNVEEYLYGVLPAEIPAGAHPEALKAQAVAARTIAFKNMGRHKKQGFNFCADVHCQSYQGLSVEAVAAAAAVDATRGQVITYKGEPIETFYHANCGGCLCSDTFDVRPYLAPKFDAAKGLLKGKYLSDVSLYEEDQWFYDQPDSFCSSPGGGNFRWQRIYDRQDFLLAFGFPLKDLGEISFREKGDCFHYTKIEVTASDRTVLDSGLKIRNYFDKLRSNAFKLERFKSPSDKSLLFFWGAGFGHGAGLCQEGAMRQANEGYDYKEILKHYYPNTEIKRMY